MVWDGNNARMGRVGEWLDLDLDLDYFVGMEGDMGGEFCCMTWLPCSFRPFLYRPFIELPGLS